MPARRAGAGAPSIGLPSILSSEQTAHAGTYIADHQSNRSINLFGAGVPRRPAGLTEQRSPRKVKIGRAGRIERDHFTVLPALATLQPLLSRAPSPSEEEEEEEGASRLPELPQLRASEALRCERAVSRLYPGRCALTPLGEKQMPVPSDDEFRDWLRLPSIGRDRTNCLPTPSPRSGGQSARPSPVARSPSAQTGALAEDELKAVEELGDEALGDEDAAPPPLGWRIVLLRSTFEDPGNSRQSVAMCLAEKLGLDLEEAARRAQDAQSRPAAVVHRCGDQREASEKAQQLRAGGLTVQLKSEGGVEPASSSSSPGKRPSAKDYGELFDISLKGARRTAPGRKFVRATTFKERRRVKYWKGEFEQVAIPVLPVDPVEVLLSTEKGKKLQPEALLKRPIKPAELTADLPAGTSPSLSPANSPVHRASKRASLHRTSVTACVVLEAVMPDQKLSPARREVCQMMRFFVFSEVGNERLKKVKDREQVFYEPMGSMDKIRTLFYLWKRLDSDRSGRIDIHEFRAFAERNLWEKAQAAALAAAQDAEGAGGGTPRPVMNSPARGSMSSQEETNKFVARLCNRLASILLPARRGSFEIEDVMRLLWPCAQTSHLLIMRGWCREINNRLDRRRARTPPVLPESDFAALCSVFRHANEGRSGSLRIEELVNQGLIYRSQATAFLKLWDRNVDGTLDMLEFCEMMCPPGYRAHEKATIGGRKDGARVAYDPDAKYWRLEESDDEHEFVVPSSAEADASREP